MLSLAKSRYTLVSRLCFLAVNALGLVLGTLYDAKTPDLYPSNVHGKVGWILTLILSVQALMSLVNRAARAIADRPPRLLSETLALVQPPRGPVDAYHRLSNDSGQGTEPHTELLRSQSVTTLGDGFDDDDERSPLSNLDKEHGRPDGGSAAALSARVASMTAWRYLDLLYQAVDRLILPCGFVGLITGIATFGRLFVGSEPCSVVWTALIVGVANCQ